MIFGTFHMLMFILLKLPPCRNSRKQTRQRCKSSNKSNEDWLLTTWSRVLLVKLMVTQLVKKLEPEDLLPCSW